MAYGALPLYPIAIAMLLINNPINAVYAAMIFFIFVSMIIAYAMGIKVWSNKKKALTFSFYMFYQHIISVGCSVHLVWDKP